jgi:uncharacterized membrane protein
MSIKKELSELVAASVISEDTADNIRNYYAQKSNPSQNKLFVIFGILGALLMGLGIILIIAHNWDELSILTKTILAFVPLILSQLACGYTLTKQQMNTTWRESASTLLFLAIGASISLISQIYNIPGDISSFLLTWLLLGLPLVYVMQSSFTSILYITGATVYGAYDNYWMYYNEESYLFWLLLLAIIPYYYLLYKKNPRGHFLLIHHWFIAIAFTISLATLAHTNEELIFVAYMNLFCFFTLIGHAVDQKNHSGKANAYVSIGQIATMILLLVSTFHDFWQGVQSSAHYTAQTLVTSEFIAVIITAALAVGVLVYKKVKLQQESIRPLETVFIYFIVIYIIGLFSPMTAVFTNILFLVLSIQIIREGIKKEHLGITNLGLLMITALVACRFFDTDLQFAVRGMMFLFVGVGFFVTNFLMIKKRNG